MRRNLPNLPIEELIRAIDIADEAVEMNEAHVLGGGKNLPPYLYVIWHDEPNVAVRLIDSNSLTARNRPSEPQTGFARANRTDEYDFETGVRIALLRAAAKIVERN